MSDYKFSMSVDDTSPAIQVTCQDSSGTAVSVAGASEVRFKMQTQDKVTDKVNNTANTSIVDGAAGIVKYDWQTGDTDTAGVYLAKFIITYSDGTIETFPNAGRYIKVTIGV